MDDRLEKVGNVSEGDQSYLQSLLKRYKKYFYFPVSKIMIRVFIYLGI
jgi:hypothetical protein